MHTDIPTRVDLEQLLAVRDAACVSIYVPTAPEERGDDAVNYGVVDEVARRVLLARGRVLAVRRPDIPGNGPAAAILRYPV